MRVNAGELNKRIRIIRRIVTKDADGYDTPKDEVVHTCWAKFSQTSGTEIVRANSDFGQERVRFLIRWTRTPIDRKMLVCYGGSEYEIQFINDYGDSHEYIELWCLWQSMEVRP